MCRIPRVVATVFLVTTAFAAIGCNDPRVGGGKDVFAVIRVNYAQANSSGGQPSGSDNAYATFKQTHAELLRSPFLLNRVLQLPQVAKLEFVKGLSDPSAWLQRSLEIQNTKNSELLLVRLRGGPPTELAEIINGLLEVFQSEVIDEQRREDVEQVHRLKDEIHQQQNRLDQLTKVGAELGRVGTDSELGRMKRQFVLDDLEILQERRSTLEEELLRIQLSVETDDDTDEETAEKKQYLGNALARTEKEVEVKRNEALEMSKTSAEYAKVQDQVETVKERLADHRRELARLESKAKDKSRIRVIQRAVPTP